MPIDQLTEADLPALQALARECLDADGGLPLSPSPRCCSPAAARADPRGPRGRRAARSRGVTVDGARRPQWHGRSGRTPPGAGHPSAGLGRGRAGGAELTVATETCGPDAERLYARHGLVRDLRREFMRHDLRSVPLGPPVGVRVIPVSEAARPTCTPRTSRPSPTGPGSSSRSRAEWLAELESDPDWRRDLSAAGAGPPPAAGGLRQRPGRAGWGWPRSAWIDQVGVVPEWRGRGLGAHLVARTLRALAVESTEPRLAVRQRGQPRRRLYRRLGFTDAGTRARYARAQASLSPRWSRSR